MENPWGAAVFAVLLLALKPGEAIRLAGLREVAAGAGR